MGREMGKDDDEESQDVNVQEIATDPQIPGPGTDPPKGLGTNFTHVKANRTVKDSEWDNMLHLQDILMESFTLIQEEELK